MTPSPAHLRLASRTAPSAAIAAAGGGIAVASAVVAAAQQLGLRLIEVAGRGIRTRRLPSPNGAPRPRPEQAVRRPRVEAPRSAAPAGSNRRVGRSRPRAASAASAGCAAADAPPATAASPADRGEERHDQRQGSNESHAHAPSWSSTGLRRRGRTSVSSPPRERRPRALPQGAYEPCAAVANTSGRRAGGIPPSPTNPGDRGAGGRRPSPDGAPGPPIAADAQRRSRRRRTRIVALVAGVCRFDRGTRHRKARLRSPGPSVLFPVVRDRCC